MPPRPTSLARSKHTPNRLSAVYIGTNPQQAAFAASPSLNLSLTSPPTTTQPQIPDLPEPPSPGGSSNGSGLPSPPATNSTGSGSTNDDPHPAVLDRKPFSLSINGAGVFKSPASNSMLKGPTQSNSGHSTRAHHRSNSSISSITSALTRSSDRQSILTEEVLPPDDEILAGEDRDVEDEELDGDGEDTARFDLRRGSFSGSINTSSSENILALQRAKNLTQRNRMILDKLSSFPRATTPSSASGSSTTKSSTSRYSSTRRPTSSHSHSQSQPHPSSPAYDPRSGSETERESKISSSHSHHSGSSQPKLSSSMDRDDTISAATSRSHNRTVSYAPMTVVRPTTPPSRATASSSYRRTRVPSAPTSPSQVRNDLSNSSGGGSSNSPARRRRKRMSMLSFDDDDDDWRHDTARGHGVEHNWRRDREPGSVAGSTRTRRESPKRYYEHESSSATGGGGNNGRRRGALPAEFLNAAEMDRDGRLSTEPESMAPLRAPSIAFTNSNSSSASASASISTTSSSNRPRHFIRHSYSSDLSATTSATTPSVPSRRGARTPILGMTEYRERKQSYRGGSAESALAYGRGPVRLIGEGLRAAGLSPTRIRTQRYSFSGEGAEREAELFRRRKQEWHDGHDGESDDDDGDRYGGRRVERRRADTIVPGRTNGNTTGRAVTSLGVYRDRDRSRTRDYEDGPDDYRYGEDARPLRSAKSVAGFFPRDLPDRAPSALSRYGTLTRAHVLDSHTSQQQQPERYPSPLGNTRRHAVVPADSSGLGTSTNGQQQQGQEHTRLMLESLIMFEGHAQRSESSMTGEMIKGAQALVGAAEKLNEMLRYGTARALGEQVHAEVEDGDVGGNGRSREMELWGRVGAEYREGLRVSDELVRGLTGFLLGVGKTLKELTSGAESSVHGRSISLDEEGLGRIGSGRKRGSMSPDIILVSGSDRHQGSSNGGSASGRRSVNSRRSWEPGKESIRDDATQRLAARVESVLSGARPPSALNTLRERERRETPPPTTVQPSSNSRNAQAEIGGSGSVSRKLFTPREQREMQQNHNFTPGGMPTIHSQESLYGEYEPSPTPVMRANQTSLDRSRTLPPLSIQRPLPALPSESVRRSQTITDKPAASTVRDRGDRRKPSMPLLSTVRANAAYLPSSLTTPSNATTAVTPHTVSTTHTPERTPFPSLPRTDSDRSARTTVTFSRPTTVSISTLNGMIQNQRKRTESDASAGAEPSTSVRPDNTPMLSPERAIQSGSETERPPKRQQHQTLGRLGRRSLDGATALGRSAHPADRSAAVTAGGSSTLNTTRRERRKTVTDIWPQD